MLIKYTSSKVNGGMGHQPVYKHYEDGRIEELSPLPSRKINDHSPDFNYSYSGSGPAQLALGILLDATGDPEVSLNLYQWFKDDFISKLGESWEIKVIDILDWLKKVISPIGLLG